MPPKIPQNNTVKLLEKYQVAFFMLLFFLTLPLSNKHKNNRAQNEKQQTNIVLFSAKKIEQFFKPLLRNKKSLVIVIFFL